MLDTNVLASAFAHPRSVPAAVLQFWRLGGFDLIVSEAVLSELAHTLEKPYFTARLTPDERDAGLVALYSSSTFVVLSDDIESVATHPEDDLILATVALGRADYLVIGDQQLLALGAHAGARIVSPRAFLDLLAAP